MRTDSPVNHGNSGGGLFDKKGDLIGIVSAKLVEEDVEGIAYAIPSNLALALVDNIIENCLGTSVEKVQKPLLGIEVTISESYSVYDVETGRISIKETTVVSNVTETSLLFGKLLKDDIITAIKVGDKSITLTRQYQLLDALLYGKSGELVTLTVLRENSEGKLEEVSISATLTDANINTVE